ncbi:MAG: cysteate synthase [Bacteroidota bacterium]
MNDFRTTYQLKSLFSGKEFDDTGWLLEATGEERPSLIRAIYPQKQLHVKVDSLGLYKFSDWLPIQRILKGSSAPVTYKSEGFAAHLGLKNLYITFSGYWPEKGAGMRTCAFKETEAYSVCGRLDAGKTDILVVASAGNTARSFARVCSDNDIPLLLCMPEDCLDSMWFDEPIKDCVKLIVTRSGSDYYDAIHLSNLVCQIEGFIPEGGAKNVARRDGMGTTVLSAVTTIGRIPEYYFQAVGSGTGAIAAWEANIRLLEDGRFGTQKMKLMLSQNKPFLPMLEAWNAHSRDLLPLSDVLARQQVMEITAKVLSNRKPPYGIVGGLFDAMTDNGGEFYGISNDESAHAARIFEQTEGIDIHPAAAVAVASLIQAVNENHVSPDSLIMLNITGGGEARLRRDFTLTKMTPSMIFGVDETVDEVKVKLRSIF